MRDPSPECWRSILTKGHEPAKLSLKITQDEREPYTNLVWDLNDHDQTPDPLIMEDDLCPTLNELGESRNSTHDLVKWQGQSACDLPDFAATCA
ncbi:hypothetical protein VNO77_01962 [Canavalia gladiata]|uniref:Uncharacterized protein n=1 Tax=Canavalia gladiata TaxID=3824 RepID=A0AAN9R2L2_CANGL